MIAMLITLSAWLSPRQWVVTVVSLASVALVTTWGVLRGFAV